VPVILTGTIKSQRVNMNREETPIPTEMELEILNVLWKEGPCTVREVQDILNRTKNTGYTTVLKMLQIMTQKRLVTRDESNHAHVYLARCSKQNTQKRLVDNLLVKAFGGSPVQLASTLFCSEKLTKTEFENLRNEILALQKEENENGDSKAY
jgi:predicted transcriptional regulator